VRDGLKQGRDVLDRPTQPDFGSDMYLVVRIAPGVRSNLYITAAAGWRPIRLTRKLETMVWEERWHPLRREWVIVSSHRNDRPWLGETVDEGRDTDAPYDPSCYLCPRNTRISGRRTPTTPRSTSSTTITPVSGPASPEADRAGAEHLSEPPRRRHGARGVLHAAARPHAGRAHAAGDRPTARDLREQYLELGDRPEVRHVLAFENKGEVVGVSNPHPHAQIYATNFVFRTIETEVQASTEHLAEHGRPLFRDVIDARSRTGRRLVVQQGSALSFVPYFARYPYETYIAPRESHQSLAGMSGGELADLAEVLRRTLVRMDNLWRMSFPT
jgi:UDPglucose--hexose-1-phosphate uridylyltransferase